MKNKIRLVGLILPGTVSQFKDDEVTSYAIDFRPTSFNFLQLYKAEELLKQFASHSLVFSLIFENEKDFVIKKILEDVGSILPFGQLILEFWGNETLDYCEQFRFPFYKANCDEENLLGFLNAPLCKGIVWNDFNRKTFFSFLNLSVLKNKPQLIHLNHLDQKQLWSDIFPRGEMILSLVWSLPIICYFERGVRFMDLVELKKAIHYVQSSL